MWYNAQCVWIEHHRRTWKQFEDRLIQRFCALGYIEQLDEALRSPTQAQGESVNSYEERYRCLFSERAALDASLSLDSLRRYWVMGLLPKFRLELLKDDATTFDGVTNSARTIERALALMHGQLPNSVIYCEVVQQTEVPRWTPMTSKMESIVLRI